MFRVHTQKKIWQFTSRLFLLFKTQQKSFRVFWTYFNYCGQSLLLCCSPLVLNVENVAQFAMSLLLIHKEVLVRLSVIRLPVLRINVRRKTLGVFLKLVAPMMLVLVSCMSAKTPSLFSFQSSCVLESNTSALEQGSRCFGLMCNFEVVELSWATFVACLRFVAQMKCASYVLSYRRWLLHRLWASSLV